MALLEELLAQLNGSVFLREFSFSRTRFSPLPSSEIEFADHVVFIDGVWMLFQLKEREQSAEPAGIARWIERKVLTAGTRQIRDTLRYLRTYKDIHLVNQRGHRFNVANFCADRIFKIILYETYSSDAPQPPRFHISRTAGFIHVFRSSDYFNVCQYLFTPAEIWEYLTFREQLLRRCPTFADEAALTGQFISGELQASPSQHYWDVLARFADAAAQFDVRFLLENFRRNIYDQGAAGDTDYYKIVGELAKLTRSELRSFKERFRLCLQAAATAEVLLPYRFVSVPTGCGFIFIPLPASYRDNRRVALSNFTLGAKYDQRLTKQIGIAVVKDGEHVLIDWMYLEGQWELDPEMEEHMRDAPLRPLKTKRTARYHLLEADDDPDT